MNKYCNSTILLNALYTEISEMQGMVASTPCVAKASVEGIAIPVNKEVSQFKYGTEKDGTYRRDLKVVVDSINHDCAGMHCDLGHALRIAAETVKIDTDGSIYGMIWASRSDSNFRLNILHPIVVQAIVAGEYSELVKLDTQGTLYVYEYKNSTPRTKFDDTFAEEVIERWVEILTIISSEGYSPNTQLKCSTNMGSLCNAIRQGSTSLESAQIAFNESGNNPSKVITPLMFVTSGMLFPYYGAVMSRISGGRYESRDLMHWGSCNLDHRRDIGGWGGTCTGNLSSSVYASLRVLTNLNTGSPHHTDVISTRGDMRTYVKVAQEMSTEIMFEHFKDEWVLETAPSEVEEDSKETSKAPSTVGEEVVVVKKKGRPAKGAK